MVKQPFQEMGIHCLPNKPNYDSQKLNSLWQWLLWVGQLAVVIWQCWESQITNATIIKSMQTHPLLK